jgi:hypothetical protein
VHGPVGPHRTVVREPRAVRPEAVRARRARPEELVGRPVGTVRSTRRPAMGRPVGARTARTVRPGTKGKGGPGGAGPRGRPTAEMTRRVWHTGSAGTKSVKVRGSTAWRTEGRSTHGTGTDHVAGAAHGTGTAHWTGTAHRARSAHRAWTAHWARTAHRARPAHGARTAHGAHSVVVGRQKVGRRLGTAVVHRTAAAVAGGSGGGAGQAAAAATRAGSARPSRIIGWTGDKTAGAGTAGHKRGRGAAPRAGCGWRPGGRPMIAGWEARRAG